MHKSKQIREKEKYPWDQEHGNQINTKVGTDKIRNSHRKKKK